MISKLQYFLFQENAVSNQWISEFVPAEAMTVDYRVGDYPSMRRTCPVAYCLTVWDTYYTSDGEGTKGIVSHHSHCVWWNSAMLSPRI